MMPKVLRYFSDYRGSEMRFTLCLGLILLVLAAALHPSFRFDTIDALEIISAGNGSEPWDKRGPSANITINTSGVSLIRNQPGYTGVKALFSLESKNTDRTLLRISAKFEKLVDARLDLSAFETNDNANGILVINWLEENRELAYVKIVAQLSKLLQKGAVVSVSSIPDEAQFASIGLLLRHGVESVAMDDLSVALVRYSLSYLLLMGLLVIIFCVLIAYLFYRFVRTAGLVLPAAVAIGSCLILLATGLSSDYLNLLITKISVIWPNLMDIDQSDRILLQQLVHVLMFFMLATLTVGVFRAFRKRVLIAFLLLSLVAIGTELVQAHLLSRSADYADLLADFIGILLVFLPVFCSYMITFYVDAGHKIAPKQRTLL